jgi:enoyl-CoA hydratase/carnithine racemase
MGYQDIILEKQDGIARITLNRPEALNAFREPMRVEIGAAIREVRDDHWDADRGLHRGRTRFC